jgi:type I restriction enzyme, S subunit
VNALTSIRSKWPHVRLGEVAEHRLGKMLDSAKNSGDLRPYLRNPNIRWFEIDLTDLRKIRVEDSEVHKYELQLGDVLICEGGEAGRAAIWNGEAEGVIFQKACHRVRVGANLDARFLVHCLMHDYFSGKLNDYYTGATIKHLTGQDLARYEILLPPLDEQRRIAAILDKADELRRKRRHAIECLRALRQSIFGEMFDLNKGFRSAALSEICQKITDGTHQSPRWSERGIPFLFVSNVRDQQISFDTKKFVSDEEYGRLTKQCPIEPGDVLYTAVGSYGHTAVVPLGKKFAFQRHIAHLKPRHDLINPFYLANALEMPGAKRQADREARGVAQKTVTLESLKKMVIPLPPMQLQEAFEDRLASIDQLRGTLAEAVASDDALFLCLQEHAFSAELQKV